nr:PREDICTED: uncharacterized protein LOC105669262 [Linepithema humile]
MGENILFVLIFVLLCIGLAATSDLSGYKPRGWRPDGPRFNSNNNRLHTYYGAPGLENYEPPDSALSTTTTPQPPTTTTSTSIKTSTTPRNREPTTAPNEQPEDDFNTNPALAVANSFAFNRPVYIYNAFPFPLAQIITQ